MCNYCKMKCKYLDEYFRCVSCCLVFVHILLNLSCLPLLTHRKCLLLLESLFRPADQCHLISLCVSTVPTTRKACYLFAIRWHFPEISRYWNIFAKEFNGLQWLPYHLPRIDDRNSEVSFNPTSLDVSLSGKCDYHGVKLKEGSTYISENHPEDLQVWCVNDGRLSTVDPSRND